MLPQVRILHVPSRMTIGEEMGKISHVVNTFIPGGVSYCYSREQAHMSIPPGYRGLIDRLFNHIALSGSSARVVQVKMKFNELRIYVKNAEPETNELIAEIAEIASATCRSCGTICPTGRLQNHNCRECFAKIDQSLKREIE